MLSLPLWIPNIYYEAFAMNRIQGRASALRTAGLGKFTYHAAWDLMAALAMGGSGVIVIVLAAVCGFSFFALPALPFQIVSCLLAGLQMATLVDVLQNAVSSREQFQQIISPVCQLFAILSTILFGIIGAASGPVGLTVMSLFPTIPIINAVDAGVFAHYSSCGAKDVWLGERHGFAGVCA